MQGNLSRAIAGIQASLKNLTQPIPIGSVVKSVASDSVGVVIKVEASAMKKQFDYYVVWARLHGEDKEADFPEHWVRSRDIAPMPSAPPQIASSIDAMLFDVQKPTE